jgi:hypothetical protein
MALQYDFNHQLKISQGVSLGLDLRTLFMAELHGAIDAYPATKQEDKQGVDWWVEFPGVRLAVDVKIRSVDYAERGEDDLALETWSVVGRRIGWTLDPKKRCDYVLWYWKPTGRWCMIPFRQLLTVFHSEHISWRAAYKWKRQETIMDGRAYESECVFVPRVAVLAAIARRYGGRPVMAA